MPLDAARPHSYLFSIEPLRNYGLRLITGTCFPLDTGLPEIMPQKFG
jgi:hypothetical protein